MKNEIFNNTRKIMREEIVETIKFISRIVNIDRYYLETRLVGSAMMIHNSSDIDLNIDIDLFDRNKIYRRLCNFLGKENVKRKNGNIFASVPICCIKNKGRVKVDFLFGNEKWQNFSYYSPGYLSQYEGLYRTELLKTITELKNDFILYSDNNVVAKIGPVFTHDMGVVWKCRHKTFKKNGKLTRQFKEISLNDFNNIYKTNISVLNKTITDPNEFSRFIFDDTVTHFNLRTYEDVKKIIIEKYPNDIKTIYNMYMERLNNLSVLPPETKEW